MSKRFMKKEKRGAVGVDYLVYIGIAVAAFVLGLLIYFIIGGKFEGLLEALKNLFRFGR